MKKFLTWFRDVIFIPLLLGIIFLVAGARFESVKDRAVLSMAWFKVLLTEPVPMWQFLIVLSAVASIGMSLLKKKTVQSSDQQKTPVLHVTWDNDSVWGWTCTNFVEDPHRTYMFRGNATFALDHADKPITLVGVELEDATPIGAFPEINIYVNRARRQSITLNFMGTGPQGNDYNTAALTFIDAKGNKYPTKPHRFLSLPIPERVGYDRHGSKAVPPR